MGLGRFCELGQSGSLWELNRTGLWSHGNRVRTSRASYVGAFSLMGMDLLKWCLSMTGVKTTGDQTLAEQGVLGTSRALQRGQFRHAPQSQKPTLRAKFVFLFPGIATGTAVGYKQKAPRYAQHRAHGAVCREATPSFQRTSVWELCPPSTTARTGTQAPVTSQCRQAPGGGLSQY